MLGYIEAYASADDREHSAWFAAPEVAASGGGRPNARPAWSQSDYLLSAVATKGDAWCANALWARPDFPVDSLLFFNPRPPENYPGHVTTWHREQLVALELIESLPPLPKVNPDGAVVIHPGSGGDAKCWPRESFLALGRNLKRNGIIPTFILGEAEQERWGHKVVDALKSEFPWYLHMGLYELAEKLSRARLYIGNDSGVTHLAAAMGVPVIALFGPSNEHQWGPIGPNVQILRAPAPNDQDLTTLEEPAVLHEVLAELRKF
jgi:hypothetical protein